MTRFRLAIALCFLLIPAARVSGQGSMPVTGLTSNPAYEKNCAKCHGKDARGRLMHGPSLASVKVASASDDDLGNIITNGKGHMPKYSGKLTSDEINALVHEIRDLPAK